MKFDEVNQVQELKIEQGTQFRQKASKMKIFI